ncbi:MAG: hypothetical protein H6Q37_2102 [Chloroflexi bacterium]|nr:hypothetical protein [Chloroflexota bacterium]
MHKTNNTISIVLFIIGAIIGILFNAMALWPDYEASLFNSGLDADEGMGSLRCPILINDHEHGLVRASVTNPLDRNFKPDVRASISQGYVTLMRQSDQTPLLAPGETQNLHWTVNPEDAAWKRVILFRAYQFRAYPVPSRTGACGILVVNISIPGSGLTILWVAASLLLMGTGMWLWVRGNQPLIYPSRNVVSAMTAMGIVVLAGIASALAALMVVGLITLVVSILMSLAMLAHFTHS